MRFSNILQRFWHKCTYVRTEISLVLHICGINDPKIRIFVFFGAKIDDFLHLFCFEPKNNSKIILERKSSMMPTKWDFKTQALIRFESNILVN